MKKRNGAWLGALRQMIRASDLAAVVIHLNDTYLIESRLPQIPGLARVARLVKWTRKMSLKYCGEDRVLVVHSGDFLSPSYMSNARGVAFKGKQMIDLLNHCELDATTLGNHEFDFGYALLQERMAKAEFPALLSNIRSAGEQKVPWQELLLWPPASPFIAVVGLAGRATVKSAIEANPGLEEVPIDDAVESLLSRLQETPSVGCLIVLSHMERDEDHQLRRTFERLWKKEGMLYILGGHDHDISWEEQTARTALVKNFANCRSLTAALISKAAVVSPLRLPHRRQRSREFELAVALMPKALEAAFETSSPAAAQDLARRALLEYFSGRGAPCEPAWRTPREVVVQAIETWQSLSASAGRPDFNDAFGRLIEEAASTYGQATLLHDDFMGEATPNLVSFAKGLALATFKDGIFQLDSVDFVERFKPDRAAGDAVAHWQKCASRQEDAGYTIADFSGSCERLDASEASLRQRSTDFGNFVADAVRAATDADVVLINSGAFRIDGDIDARVNAEALRDTFLYDRPGAVRVIKLTEGELEALLGHSVQKAGTGAFLQISSRRKLRPGRKIAVAISDYLIDPVSIDGYLELLSEFRGLAQKRVLDQLRRFPRRPQSLIELISAGAASVAYSRETRIEARSNSPDPMQLPVQQVCDFIDEYLLQCERAGLSRQEAEAALMIEFGEPRPLLPARVAAAHEALKGWIAELVGSDRAKVRLDGLFTHLGSSRRRFETQVDYVRLLGYAIEDVLWGRGA